MKENQECEVIKDLLPNYIEGLTSEKTNEFIAEHLKKCENCKISYEIMNEELNVEENSTDKKKIKIFRKINKKIRILQAIIFSIIIIYLAIYAKNFLALNKIVDLAESHDFNNFYQKEVTTTEKFSRTLEYYQNNENLLYISTTINSNNDVRRSMRGRYNGEFVYYCEVNGIPEPLDELSSTEVEPLLQWPFINKFGVPGLALVPGIVRSTTLNGRDCYLVELEGDMFFIDKETGMEIKRINSGDNSVYDRTYSFGTVTDEQIEKIIDTYSK